MTTAAIDARRIAGLLARDWGFHHTATAQPGAGRRAWPATSAIDFGARRDRAGATSGPACCSPRSTPSRRARAGGCGTGSASASSGGRTWTRRRPRTDGPRCKQEQGAVAQRGASAPSSSPPTCTAPRCASRSSSRAAKFYGADTLLLGGDISAKIVVPIVSAGRRRGTWPSSTARPSGSTRPASRTSSSGPRTAGCTPSGWSRTSTSTTPTTRTRSRSCSAG